MQRENLLHGLKGSVLFFQMMMSSQSGGKIPLPFFRMRTGRSMLHPFSNTTDTRQFGMTDMPYRILPATGGMVQCLPKTKEEIIRCRFCIHSKQFKQDGKWVPSPARAFCLASRATTTVDVKRVSAVCCNDMVGEGFSSMMNVIS